MARCPQPVRRSLGGGRHCPQKTSLYMRSNAKRSATDSQSCVRHPRRFLTGRLPIVFNKKRQTAESLGGLVFSYRTFGYRVGPPGLFGPTLIFHAQVLVSYFADPSRDKNQTQLRMAWRAKTAVPFA